MPFKMVRMYGRTTVVMCNRVEQSGDELVFPIHRHFINFNHSNMVSCLPHHFRHHQLASHISSFETYLFSFLFKFVVFYILFFPTDSKFTLSRYIFCLHFLLQYVIFFIRKSCYAFLSVQIAFLLGLLIETFRHDSKYVNY